MGDTSVEEEGDTIVAKPAKEVPVIIDEGSFTHHTGDTYEGFFEAKKKDHIAKMHGQGIYTTAEGDVYTGLWEGDKLGGVVTINFSDSSVYEGFFKEWSFNGHGKYVYPDKSILICDFNENCPVGNLTLFDPNGHTWLGKPDQGFGWLEPVNHYYAMLESKSRESLTVKRRRKMTEV